MKMLLMTGCGVSSLIPFGDADAATYWISRIVQKGGLPEFEVFDSEDIQR